MTQDEAGCEIFRWYTECALRDGCATVEEIVVWILDCLAGRLPALATPQGQAALQAAVREQLADLQQDPSPCALAVAIEQLAPVSPGLTIAEALEILFNEPLDIIQAVGIRH